MNRLGQMWQWVRRAVRRVLELTFVDPVVSGRPHVNAWNQQLRALGLATAVIYMVVGLLVVFSSQLRQTPLVLSNGSTRMLPQLAVPIVFGALVWVLILAHTALLHMVWYIKLALTAFLVASTVMIIYANIARPFSLRLLSFAIYLVLLLFIAVRGFRRPAWWEFVVVAVSYLLVMFVSWVGPSLSSQSGTDNRIILFDVGMSTLAPIAAPTLIAAGAVPAVVTITASDAIASRPRPPRLLLIPGLVLLVAWRLYDSIPVIIEQPLIFGWQSLVSSAIVIAVTMGAAALVWVIGGRPKQAPELGELPVVWSNWLLPMGALMTVAIVWVIPFLVVRFAWLALALPGGSLLEAFWQFWNTGGGNVAWLVMWGGVGAFAVVLARRRRVAEALLLGSVAGFACWTAFSATFTSWWMRSKTLTGITSITSWIAIIMLVAWLATGRLSRTRVVAVTTVLVAGALYNYRNLLDDPLSAAIGSAGVAALMFGLVWQLITNAENTRIDGRRFPQTTRIYLYLANGLLALLTVTFAVLSRDNTGTTPEDYQSQGDNVLGTPLFLATCLLAYVIAVRNTSRQPEASAENGHANPVGFDAADHGSRSG